MLISYGGALAAAIVLAITALSGLFWGVISNGSTSDATEVKTQNISRLAMFSLLIAFGSVLCLSGNNFGLNSIIDTAPTTSFVLYTISFLYLLSLAMLVAQSNKKVDFEYHILILLSLCGLTVSLCANDLLSIFLAIEMHSLSIYILVVMGGIVGKREESAVKYFVLGSLATIIMLYGMSLIYGHCATLQLEEVRKTLHKGPVNMGEIGMVLLCVGLLFKIAAAPFHMWIADVYEGSESILLYLSSVAKLAIIFLLMRLLYCTFYAAVDSWQILLQVTGVASIFLGSAAALRQKKINRLMAYASVANMGFILLGMSSADTYALQAAIGYGSLYGIMSIGFFAIVLSLNYSDKGIEYASELGGLYQKSPLIAVMMGVFLLSFAGLPPFGGFFIKLDIIASLMSGGHIKLSIAAFAGTFLSAIYYLKIIKTIFFNQCLDETKLKIEHNWKAMLVALVCALFVAGYGVFYQFVSSYQQKVAISLCQIGP